MNENEVDLVADGIDGEAVRLESPLQFRTRPRALGVRIAPQHLGASPSATLPEVLWDTVRTIVGPAVYGMA
jgi:hypothetical protein